MKVRLLTEEQRNMLVGQQYDEDSYFNPIQDKYGRWFISEQEVEMNINPLFGFVFNLPQVDYEPTEIDISGF